MKLALFVSLLLLFQLVQSELAVNIQNGSHLVDVLCNTSEPLGDHVTIYLDSSVQYNISTRHRSVTNGCVVNVSSHSLTITGTSSGPANVTCIDQNSIDPVPTIGFMFTGINNVILSNLLITGCGASLMEYNNTINSTPPYFTKDHSGLFVFSRTSVNITRVAITQYYGFAIIIKDSLETLVDELLIKDNIGNYEEVGIGLMVLLTEDLTLDPAITISNSHFEGKHKYLQQEENRQQLCKLEDITQHNLLSIFIRRNLFRPSILITEVNFTEIVSSGILISMKDSVGGHVTITRMVFTAEAPTTCTGSAITIYGNYINGLTLIEITETTFKGSDLQVNSSSTLSEYGPVLVNMMNLRNQATVLFRKVTFQDNRPALNGACLTVTGYDSTTYRITVIMESVTAYGNSQELWCSYLWETGLFVLDNADHIVINGTMKHPGQFYNNKGSVIMVKNSDIVLKGHLFFNDNHAKRGAVINAMDTIVHFEKSLSFTMINNTAKEVGGALYIVNSFHQGLPDCALQLASSNELNITAINNTACTSGNIGYVYPLYHCYSHTQRAVISTMEYYLGTLGIKYPTQSNTRLLFSTKAEKIEICANSSSGPLTLYPGRKIQLSVRSVDWNNSMVHSRVSVSLQKTKYKHDYNYLEIKNRIQYTSENNEGNCSLINITITSLITFNDSENFNIVLSAPGVKTFATQQIQLLQCPPGFQLSNGVCQCSNTTTKFFNSVRYKGDCDIYEMTISKPFSIFPWMGIDLASEQFTIAKNCPKEICKFQTERIVFQYNNSIYVVLSPKKISPICHPHRQGVACGQCVEGYSVVFGSSECRRCSNWWLWTIVLYLIAGPVLISSLYALKLTLAAGTINGLIFFAQICYAGLVQSETKANNDTKYIRLAFIGFLNLNLGFPLCFFDGMNELWKGAINLLFPIYLIALIGLIVLISRYSSWFSKRVSPHSIQVLITVVHLSVSTLLTSVIDVSIPIKIWTANGTHYVWRSDGSVQYMSGYHVMLFVATITVATIILLPYLTILLFGKWFSKKSPKCSIYIRPIHEAINAPYKEKYHYWFTGQLLFIILMYSVYAFNKASNNKSASVYVAIMLTVFLFIQASFRPLKSKLLNVIELIFIFSMAVSFFAYYVAVKQIIQGIITVPFTISGYVAIMIFIGIIAYHVAMVTGYLRKLKEVMRRSFIKIKQKKTITKDSEVNPSDSQNLRIHDGSFYNSLSDYREPFIGHTSIDI